MVEQQSPSSVFKYIIIHWLDQNNILNHLIVLVSMFARVVDLRLQQKEGY